MTRHFTECMNLLRCCFDLSEGEIFQLIAIGAHYKRYRATERGDSGKELHYHEISDAAKNCQLEFSSGINLASKEDILE